MGWCASLDRTKDVVVENYEHVLYFSFLRMMYPFVSLLGTGMRQWGSAALALNAFRQFLLCSVQPLRLHREEAGQKDGGKGYVMICPDMSV